MNFRSFLNLTVITILIIGLFIGTLIGGAFFKSTVIIVHTTKTTIKTTITEFVTTSELYRSTVTLRSTRTTKITVTETKLIPTTITTTLYPSGVLLMTDSGTEDKPTLPFILDEKADLRIIFKIEPEASDPRFVFLARDLTPVGEGLDVASGVIDEGEGEFRYIVPQIPLGGYYIEMLAANCKWVVIVEKIVGSTVSVIEKTKSETTRRTVSPTTEESTTTESPTTTQTPTKACDSSYPDVCIPPPPPDLGCSDIPYRNFRVLPPDPHNFDRDGDGIGCET